MGNKKIETFIKLFKGNKVNEKGLEKAVKDKVLTEDEKIQILQSK